MTGPILAFPFSEVTSPGVPPKLAWLRENQPLARVLLPSGDQAWIATRYADVKATLADERFSRVAAETPGAPWMGNTTPGPNTILEWIRLGTPGSAGSCPDRLPPDTLNDFSRVRATGP